MEVIPPGTLEAPRGGPSSAESLANDGGFGLGDAEFNARLEPPDERQGITRTVVLRT
jgi:hypothetical protein